MTGQFHPEAITNYLIEGNYKPIYPVLYYRKKKRKIADEYFNEPKLSEISLGILPDQKNITRRIVKYLELNPPYYTNPMILQKDINKLLSLIRDEYGEKKLNLLLQWKLIQTIMEKI